MAEPIKVGNKFRVLIRKAGQTRCQTFTTRAAAKAWARTIDGQIDELKSVGYVQPKGVTFGDLVDRYIEQFYPIKPWGRSKTADLARLKKELGNVGAAVITHETVLAMFLRLHKGGTGGVSISSLAGYLLKILESAKDVWRLNVPVDAARSARSALKKLGVIRKSRERNRRCTDAELERVIAHVERKATAIPFRAIVWFSVATSMRISEVCRLRWEDLNEADRTIQIRDRKHPTEKKGNHQVVPLVQHAAGHNAFEIVKAQPRKSKRIFPVNHRTVGTYFSEAVEQLKIDDLHLHDIRHEAISRLFEAGYKIEEVSVFSGHRDWAQLKRYTHIRPTSLHRAPVTGAA